MDQRAGRWVRMTARKRHLEFWKQTWHYLAGATAVPVVVGPIAVVTMPPLAAGMVIGSLVVLMPSLIWIATIQATGTASTLMGGTAEEWTRYELQKHLRGRGWQVFDDVPLEHGNVDHVAVGPEGAIAVETKWSSHAWAGVDDRRVQAAADSAYAGRTRVWGILRSHHLEPPVTPVVVLWGEWTGDDRRELAGGVHVVRGASLHEWLQSLNGEALSSEEVRTATDGIRSYVAKLDANRPAESLLVEHSPWQVGVGLLQGVLAGLLGMVITAALLATVDWRVGLGLHLGLVAAGVAAYRRFPPLRQVAIGWIAGVAGMSLVILASVAILMLV